MEYITYRHEQNPNIRFLGTSCSVPAWAIDIQAETPRIDPPSTRTQAQCIINKILADATKTDNSLYALGAFSIIIEDFLCMLPEHQQAAALARLQAANARLLSQPIGKFGR